MARRLKTIARWVNQNLGKYGYRATVRPTTYNYSVGNYFGGNVVGYHGSRDGTLFECWELTDLKDRMDEPNKYRRRNLTTKFNGGVWRKIKSHNSAETYRYNGEVENFVRGLVAKVRRENPDAEVVDYEAEEFEAEDKTGMLHRLFKEQSIPLKNVDKLRKLGEVVSGNGTVDYEIELAGQDGLVEVYNYSLVGTYDKQALEEVGEGYFVLNDVEERQFGGSDSAIKNYYKGKSFDYSMEYEKPLNSLEFFYEMVYGRAGEMFLKPPYSKYLGFDSEGGEQYDYYTIERDYDEGYMNARVPTLKTNRLFDPLYYTQHQMMNDMSDRISTAFHPNAEVREQSGYGTREKQRDAIFNGLKIWNEQMIEDLNGVKRSIDTELGDRKFEAEEDDEAYIRYRYGEPLENMSISRKLDSVADSLKDLTSLDMLFTVINNLSTKQANQLINRLYAGIREGSIRRKPFRHNMRRDAEEFGAESEIDLESYGKPYNDKDFEDGDYFCDLCGSNRSADSSVPYEEKKPARWLKRGVVNACSSCIRETRGAKDIQPLIDKVKKGDTQYRRAEEFGSEDSKSNYGKIVGGDGERCWECGGVIPSLDGGPYDASILCDCEMFGAENEYDDDDIEYLRVQFMELAQDQIYENQVVYVFDEKYTYTYETMDELNFAFDSGELTPKMMSEFIKEYDKYEFEAEGDINPKDYIQVWLLDEWGNSDSPTYLNTYDLRFGEKGSTYFKALREALDEGVKRGDYEGYKIRKVIPSPATHDWADWLAYERAYNDSYSYHVYIYGKKFLMGDVDIPIVRNNKYTIDEGDKSFHVLSKIIEKPQKKTTEPMDGLGSLFGAEGIREGRYGSILNFEFNEGNISWEDDVLPLIEEYTNHWDAQGIGFGEVSVSVQSPRKVVLENLKADLDNQLGGYIYYDAESFEAKGIDTFTEPFSELKSGSILNKAILLGSLGAGAMIGLKLRK